MRLSRDVVLLLTKEQGVRLLSTDAASEIFNTERPIFMSALL